MMYDCTPPAEPVKAHIVRVVKNLIHPAHKAYYHPAPLFCGEPEMATVTVEAPEIMDLPAIPAGSDSDASVGGGSYYSGFAAAGPGAQSTGSAPYIGEPRYTGPLDRENKPQPVPEPAEWSVMLAGFVIVVLLMRKRIHD
jgi:hypothetical protein